MSGRRCTICWRTDREAIERDAARGCTAAEVAQRFPPLKRDAVRRHLRDHTQESRRGAGRLPAAGPKSLFPRPPAASAPRVDAKTVFATRLKYDVVALAAHAEDLDWQASAARETLDALRGLLAADEKAAVELERALGVIFALSDALGLDERRLLVPGVPDETFLDDIPWTAGLIRQTFRPLADARYGAAGLEALVADAVREVELRHAYARARLEYLERPFPTWKAPAGLLCDAATLGQP